MAGISQANMEHHRQLLTRLIQFQTKISTPNSEISESEDK
ncbi:hypothetical protein [cyanobacterium endosymbiont of Epithemia clementina EcSB]|nr:hypothetical protein [cyanobacterium endosymbiont of Epithemia clementina EcSB]WGT67207.1 hypothetical protein P3F56_08300 [cyanobacterium endosymbiont of Epithemia clementina EcSB]